jgi:hypothetical protein
MSRDPRKVWQYFAHALVQEEDPEKLRYLMQQLLEALAENDEQPSLNLPRSKNAPSE